MGTNYYARYNRCAACQRYDEVHIGKQSFGWTFSFQGIDEDPEKEFRIRSYRDWLDFIDRTDALIYDEYGREVPLEEFKKMVESKRHDRFNHTLYMQGYYPDYKPIYVPERLSDNYWLDEEGHSFSLQDFS